MNTLENTASNNTEIRSVSSGIASNFIDRHHRLGSSSKIGKSLISLGCFEGEELIAVTQFCSPMSESRDGNYTVELLRVAFNEKCNASLEASKMTKFYIENYHPADIFAELDASENNDFYADCVFVLNENSSDDPVYEWINSELTFYTYKVTSPDSEKYYYGVSHLKKANATIEECLNDGYFGSGGTKSTNKFRNWKIKYADSLQKEILETFDRKALAYKKEIELIGDRYKTDRNCLNSTSGGKTGGINTNPNKYSEGSCEIHGDVKLQGKTCMKCAIGETLSVEICPEHGETKHRGRVCNKCSISSVFTEQECVEHGLTTFRGAYCAKCTAFESLSKNSCEIHGETTFRWDKCQKCNSAENYSTKICKIHGETIHNGDLCVTCANQSIVSEKDCSIHGMTKHQGDTCCKCSAAKLRSLKECQKHGLVDHMGDYCSTCNSQKSVSKRKCEIHGEVTFQGETCCKCAAAKKYSVKICEIHGEATHSGSTCTRCIASRRKANLKINKID